MPVEEFNYRIIYPISYIKILRYALGARGIDRIERVPMYGSHLVGYPLYDAHGNNIATLTIDHANHFSVPASDKRSYGPWGDIRTGSTTGEPQPRHRANLGHLSDDESGFVYMRARYYEPGSGRFISEDPGRDGLNWFGYCRSNPVGHVDQSGKNASDVETSWSIYFSALSWGLSAATSSLAFGCFLGHAAFMIVWFLGWDTLHGSLGSGLIHAGLLGLLGGVIAAMEFSSGARQIAWMKDMSPGASAIAVIGEHVGFIALFLSMEAVEEAEAGN